MTNYGKSVYYMTSKELNEVLARWEKKDMEHYHPTEFSVEGLGQCLELIEKGGYYVYYNRVVELWEIDSQLEIVRDRDFQHAVCRLAIEMHRYKKDYSGTDKEGGGNNG